MKNGGFTPFSFMYNTEHVLFGQVGNLPLLKMGVRLSFEGRRREHSRKPEEFYEIVWQVSPKPRIDLFARQRREGFDAWGNETEKFGEAGRMVGAAGVGGILGQTPGHNGTP